jgi:hypothetical protein
LNSAAVSISASITCLASTGWEQCVDVAATHRVFDGAYRDAAVGVDQKARYPSNAESASDEATCGEWVACGRHDPGIEAGIAAGLNEEALFGRHDPIVFGELRQ